MTRPITHDEFERLKSAGFYQIRTRNRIRAALLERERLIEERADLLKTVGNLYSEFHRGLGDAAERVGS